MSRLTKDKYSDGRKEGRMPNGDFLYPENGDHLPSGVMIDGAAYTLADQPSTAKSHGWGYIGWMLRPWIN